MVPETYGELEESNALLNHIPMLRERLNQKGYLFFRNVFDKSTLLEIRRDMLRLAENYGLIQDGTDSIDGIYKGGAYPTSAKFETSRLYREILELPGFNAFGQHPMIMLLFSGLLEGEILEHRRRIGRITFPKSFNNTTPAHQDYFYIRGTMDTYTNWIPAGDCPRELGGLAVLEGSNHLGFLPHEPMSGTGGHGIRRDVYEASGLRWLTTDFKTGDWLLFHGLTIHKALDNITENQMRVSLEYRVQRNGERIDPGSMVYHMKGAFGENEIE